MALLDVRLRAGYLFLAVVVGHLVLISAQVNARTGVPILETKDMKDGQQMAMSDGTKVTFHVKDGKVMVDNANIVASIKCMNGVVHVVDAVLLPPAK